MAYFMMMIESRHDLLLFHAAADAEGMISYELIPAR